MKLRTIFATITLCISVGISAENHQILNAIDEYVRADDDSYEWSVHSIEEGEGLTYVVIDLVSQNWLTSDEVDRTEWRHWLILTVPNQVASTTALLYISGGTNNDAAPKPNDMTTGIALMTRTVVAELRTIPNQPLVFQNDSTLKQRYEDDLIGYAWNHYLETNDVRWLPRGPMVKSAVRAMDAITSFFDSNEAFESTEVDRYVVAGASKRGWTAWMTAAMDERVIAVAPIVIDVLNVRESMEHHFSAYGFWAPAIGNYVEHGMMTQWMNPQLDELYKLVDPYVYLDRIKIPQLVLNASGDQFFLPDSSQFYWEQLTDEKFLRYVPNADHSLGNSNGVETLTAFHALIVSEQEFPSYSWAVKDGKLLEVSTTTQPIEVALWQATNPYARDFRVETIGLSYQSTPLESNDSGSYVVALDPPEQGWTAYFVELSWDVGLPIPLRLSTEVIVAPDVLPYADKDLSLPNSITLICTSTSTPASEIITAVTENIPDDSFADDGIKTATWSDNVYFNWTPADAFQAGFVEMAGLLEQVGCDSRAYQFESGGHITTPPLEPN